MRNVKCEVSYISHFTFDCCTLHYSDEISNRQFIIDFAKVVDFIEEMDAI